MSEFLLFKTLGIADIGCSRFLKLGLQGTTVIFSCGDTGVEYRGSCCVNQGCANQNSSTAGNGKTFAPYFPASCPWVTAVGATQIVPGNPVTAPEVVAEQGTFFSGGGFSNVFEEPFYQKERLRYYYDHFKPNYTAAQSVLRSLFRCFDADGFLGTTIPRTRVVILTLQQTD